MASISMLSFNVRDIADGKKWREVFNFLRDKNTDLYLLQETHASKKIQRIWRNEWGGPIYFSNGESNARGVCIMAKPRTKLNVKKIYRDTEGRFICIKIVVNDTVFVIANIYAPNEDDPEFFKIVCK